MDKICDLLEECISALQTVRQELYEETIFLAPEMVVIPGGAFVYGEENEVVFLERYRIGKYPITNAQYLEFVVDTGREWESPIGRKKEYANHPATYVSWYDARTYCEWLTAVLDDGHIYRLPTEEEWEHAAAGLVGRKYPWGQEWDANKCNTVETGIGGTTPVGAFSPQGDSPYGCADMAGNVWEWTASVWWPGNERYVIRGGAWGLDRNVARCAFRDWNGPNGWNWNVGFRVCCSTMCAENCECGRSLFYDTEQSADNRRVVRGGSCHDYWNIVRCAYRSSSGPNGQWEGSGFRVCCSVPSEKSWVVRGGSCHDYRDFAHCASRSRSFPNDLWHHFGFRICCCIPCGETCECRRSTLYDTRRPADLYTETEEVKGEGDSFN